MGTKVDTNERVLIEPRIVSYLRILGRSRIRIVSVSYPRNLVSGTYPSESKRASVMPELRSIVSPRYRNEGPEQALR
jgi:hypothetical protein